MEDSIITINKKLQISYLKTKDIVNAKQVVIHLNGINLSNSLNKFWKIPINELPAFLFLNLPGNDPKLKPYRSNKKYLKIINGFICALKQEFPKIQKIFMTGESWGASLALLYAKKYSKSIDGVVCWNAPSKIMSEASSKTKAQIFKIGMQHLACILFNTNSRSLTGDMKLLTNNDILLRIYRSHGTKNLGFTRLNLAAWFSMKPSYRYLEKHFKLNKKLPIVYIQSKQDCYFEYNAIKLNKIIKFSNDKNKIILQDEGMHLLSLDKNGNDKIIWDQIKLMTMD